MAKDRTLPWIDGVYSVKSLPNRVFVVSGENVKLQEFINGKESSFHVGSWKFGKSGDSNPEVESATGEKNNDIEITLRGGKWQVKGVVSSDGRRITIWDRNLNQHDHYDWMSEQDYITFKDTGDSWDAPISHYKIQPNNIGKLIWITGAPGTGKSTTAHTLSKLFGYVYYEGDCFFETVNPYIPPKADDPTMAVQKQKRLKGIPQEAINAISKGNEAFNAMRRKQSYDIEDVNRRFDVQCEIIANERRRIGGDWVVASSIYSKQLRNRVVEKLGPNIIIVNLEIDKEVQRERLEKRHGDNGGYHWWRNFDHWVYNLFEPITEPEPNAMRFDVFDCLSREDVARGIVNELSNFKGEI